ncbi:site-specific integrase [Parafrankia elaeagni]|uniref:site-specific integrase n=1 Tax=Parafrankia elaeagni TaxID=222534 RepID=UPI0003620B98|nr:site-specific integrase [Parafrankia elaeagni]
MPTHDLTVAEQQRLPDGNPPLPVSSPALLVSPELASVLATLVARLRAIGGGTIPLTSRYDAHGCSEGPPLPHLFQRRAGWRTAVIGYSTIESLLAAAIDRAGLVDAANRPLRYTPHDFRRMFATEAVTGGLPVHIAARLLGHHSLTTTQAYLAVFQDDLVRAYRALLDQRRAVRPQAEYREPTDEEWQDFQQHFELRKLELGTCGRPYGTPCSGGVGRRGRGAGWGSGCRHARVSAIIQNLRDRIAEAKANGWHGEVQGLEVNLNAAANKITSLDRTARSTPGRVADLGMPIISTDR